MVREYLSEVSADVELAVHLRAVEPHQARIRRELQRVVTRIAFVPRLYEPRIEVPRFAIPTRVDATLRTHDLTPSFPSISARNDSMRRSGISHINATST